MAITFSMLSLNNVNLTIRMRELKIALQNIDLEETRTDHINLIMKYSINRKLYEGLLTQDEADRIELKLNYLSLETNKYNSYSYQEYTHLTTIGIALINTIRFLMGKNPIREISKKYNNSSLMLAYYYERNFHFHEAIKHYEEELKIGNLSRSLTAGALLHQGYCHALLSQYKKAKIKYLRIMNDYGNEDIAITASLLLHYLNGFTKEQKRIIENELDSIEKGERLFKLMAYRKSIKILDKMLADSSKTEREKIYYILARSNEELGNTETALKKYMELILHSPDSLYAKQANRRMYLIGDNSCNDAIKNCAIKLSRSFYNDKILDSVISKGVMKNSDELRSKLIIKFNKKLFQNINKLIVTNPMKKSIRQNIKIHTIDGNTFVGKITGMTNEKVTLLTDIGEIIVYRKKIDKIE